ncbi:kinase family protein [Dorcoceras hygrometricum]|uniref:Kinase family protein n=1 Tax=Dorcoceras hygrometricum TaxID=472368 RepID=A0A2Z7D0U3_9LAMI|nr:kinase family protein [Dorcoceras hygrometricum]
MLISSGLIVQADEGVSLPVVDLIDAPRRQQGLTRSAQTKTPRRVGRNKFQRGKAAEAARGTSGGREEVALPNQLVVVSVQYGPFNPYIPIGSTTIGKSRVARDPIAMYTSWRSNSDIASVTRQLHTQIAASTINQIDMHREVKELNAKVDAIALNLELVKRDAEVTKEAILHQIFEFQSQAQANHIILTTQLGQIVEDLNRGGNDKKGEEVSSRGPQSSRARVPVRIERRPLPTREPSPDAQSSGQYLSAEQAAEFENIYQSTSDMTAGSISVGIQSWGIRWKSADDKSTEAFFRQISRSIISADVFIKRRVSRQLQFPLVPSIGFCDREEPAGALLDDNQQVHYLRETSRQLQ